jgi:hypothetical protein
MPYSTSEAIKPAVEYPIQELGLRRQRQRSLLEQQLADGDAEDAKQRGQDSQV